MMRSGVYSPIKFDFCCTPCCLLVKEPMLIFYYIVFLVSYNGSIAKVGYLCLNVHVFGWGRIFPSLKQLECRLNLDFCFEGYV